MAKKVENSNFGVTDDAAELTAQIASIAERHATMKTDVARAAASCVLRAVKHGDITHALSLLAALEGGWRLTTLTEWFIAKGPFAPEVNDAGKLTGKLAFDPAKRAELIAVHDASPIRFATELMRSPFWEWKPEKGIEGYDFGKVLSKLAKTAASKANNKDVVAHKDSKLDLVPAFLEWYASQNSPAPSGVTVQ